MSLNYTDEEAELYKKEECECQRKKSKLGVLIYYHCSKE